jgi:hypothetical protein
MIGARQIDHNHIDRTTEPAEHLLDDLRGQRHITRAAKPDSVHRWQTPQQPKTLDAPPVRPARTALLFEAECDVESPVESPAEPVTVQGDGARARLCRPDCDDHGEPKAPTPPDPPSHSGDTCGIHATRVAQT